jgi:hypothetical protein
VARPSKNALPNLVLNVPALAGRSESEVAEYLGHADPGMGSTDPARVKLSYWGGKVEVVFVDGRASWIKLYGTGDLPFAKEALGKLGLPVKAPTYVNTRHVMSWHNVAHLQEVSLYAGGAHGTVSSVLVCVRSRSDSSNGNRRSRISFPRLKALGGT